MFDVPGSPWELFPACSLQSATVLGRSAGCRYIRHTVTPYRQPGGGGITRPAAWRASPGLAGINKGFMEERSEE